MKVISIIFALGCLLGLPQVPRIWRNRAQFYDKPGSWWPYSKAAWRGWVRGMPAGAISGFFLGVAAVVGAFTGVLDTDAALTDTTGGTIVFVFGLAAFVGLLISVGVLYLNRPRWAAPPHLRGEPGLIAEWRRAKGT